MMFEIWLMVFVTICVLIAFVHWVDVRYFKAVKCRDLCANYDYILDSGRCYCIYRGYATMPGSWA